MTIADNVIAHIQGRLKVPTGRKAGEPLLLYQKQKDWIQGAFKPDTSVAILCMARGGGKTCLVAAIGHAGLVGVCDDQPRREIVIAARTLDQGRIAYQYVVALIEGLPAKERKQYVIRKSPRLEITYKDEDDIEHTLKVAASDGRSQLGGSPTMAIFDERGHWELERGDLAESVHMTGAAKVGGKVLMISTSSENDLHTFSRWMDDPPPHTFVMEFRPKAGLPADDMESLLEANPGAEFGVGASPDDLLKAATVAIKRGGSALTRFRWLVRNERVADENRCVVLTVDEWLRCETADLPERSGPVVIGIDIGESVSMCGACYFWPETGRTETLGTFPSDPPLLERGQNDRVGDRYVQMASRGELNTMGAKTVPVAQWVKQVIEQIQGQPVHALVADKFKSAQLSEGIEAAGFRGQVVWRRFGFFDGNEDLDRYRSACLDGEVKHAPSLLMRSAIGDAVVERDVNGNNRLTKGRSMGRIDALSSAVIAIAEGKRLTARPVPKEARIAWA